MDMASDSLLDGNEVPEARICAGDENYELKKRGFVKTDQRKKDKKRICKKRSKARQGHFCQGRGSVEEKVAS